VAARKVHCPCDACHRKSSRAPAPRTSSGFAYITPSPEVNKWNPFDILGIADNATPKQIKSAYRGLSRIWHPDKVKSELRDQADAKMAEINKAYET
ncbi:secretory subunit, partial [Entomortierella chlamydospora]